VQRRAKLPQIVTTARFPSRLSCGLNCGADQCRQYSHNRDYDKQFDKRESSSPFHDDTILGR